MYAFQLQAVYFEPWLGSSFQRIHRGFMCYSYHGLFILRCAAGPNMAASLALWQANQHPPRIPYADFAMLDRTGQHPTHEFQFFMSGELRYQPSPIMFHTYCG